jgi:hypothetical protein
MIEVMAVMGIFSVHFYIVRGAVRRSCRAMDIYNRYYCKS